MKELVKALLKAIPRYLKTLLELLRAPKGILVPPKDRESPGLTNALAYLGISIALITILTAGFQGEGRFVAEFAAQATSTLVFVAAFSLALRASWRIVGSTSLPLERYIECYAFFAGTVVLLTTINYQVTRGVLEEAEIDREVIAGLSDLASVPLSLWTALSVFLVGLLVITAWSIRFWGVYTDLHNATRRRSIVAFLVCGVVGTPISLGGYFLLSAVFP